MPCGHEVWSRYRSAGDRSLDGQVRLATGISGCRLRQPLVGASMADLHAWRQNKIQKRGKLLGEGNRLASSTVILGHLAWPFLQQLCVVFHGAVVADVPCRRAVF